jgi:hypothetical protein
MSQPCAAGLHAAFLVVEGGIADPAARCIEIGNKPLVGHKESAMFCAPLLTLAG